MRYCIDDLTLVRMNYFDEKVYFQRNGEENLEYKINDTK